MQLARLPCVVAYRANIVTEWLIKHTSKIKYMSLPNILLNLPMIPEAVFSQCSPLYLAEILRYSRYFEISGLFFLIIIR